jgi:hypothetical protein
MKTQEKVTHTPGPWKVISQGYERTGIFTNSNSQLAKIYIGNQMENARLIAAAPELLEALKEAIERGRELSERLERTHLQLLHTNGFKKENELGEINRWKDAEVRIRAAIAKAEGGN